MKDLTVIIPTLNEEKNIAKVIKRLSKNIKVIVADDGSKDATQEVVKKFKNVVFLDRSKERVKGLTASIIDAVKIVKTKYVVVIDGDMQHPPEKVDDVYQKLKSVDVVVATRKSKVGWSLKRKFISKVAIILAKMRLFGKGVKCKDPVSGFFGIKTRLFKKILKNYEEKFEKPGFKVLFDILKYCQSGVSIGEIYYNFGLRRGGESKIGSKQYLTFVRSLFK